MTHAATVEAVKSSIDFRIAAHSAGALPVHRFPEGLRPVSALPDVVSV